MLFGSTAAALQVPVRDRVPIYESGVLVGETKELVAEFGVLGPEVMHFDADGDPIHDMTTGRQEQHADIIGHACDTESQAERKGWTADERRLVEKKLEFMCEQFPSILWRISASAPVAPWPTYEQAHHNKIPVLAEELGLVEAALEYERVRPDGTRPSVVEKLEELVGKSTMVEELTAAV